MTLEVVELIWQRSDGKCHEDPDYTFGAAVRVYVCACVCVCVIRASRVVMWADHVFHAGRPVKGGPGQDGRVLEDSGLLYSRDSCACVPVLTPLTFVGQLTT